MTSVPYIEIGDSADRTQWLQLRKSGVGASEAAVLVGESRRDTRAGLWAKKVGRVDDETEEIERFFWGHAHEATIIQAFADQRYAGMDTRRHGRLLRSRRYPWAIATLDAEYRDRELWEWLPLECKANEIFAEAHWARETPPDYWWQCQHQMLVTGKPRCALAALIGVHRLAWEIVERDESAIQRLITAGERFWTYVESGEVPPGPVDKKALRSIYPSDDGETVALDGSFIALDEERESLKARVSADQSRLESIDDMIRGAIGAATCGEIANGVSYSLKTNARGVRTLRRKAPK